MDRIMKINQAETEGGERMDKVLLGCSLFGSLDD